MMNFPGLAQDPHYHLYLIGRLLESLARVERARSPKVRAVHLRACRYYCDLLLARS